MAGDLSFAGDQTSASFRNESKASYIKPCDYGTVATLKLFNFYKPTRFEKTVKLIKIDHKMNPNIENNDNIIVIETENSPGLSWIIFHIVS